MSSTNLNDVNTPVFNSSPKSTNFTRAQSEHKQLLSNLKKICGQFFHNSALNSYVVAENNGADDNDDDGVLNILTKTPDALPKLHLIIEKIFIHGIRLFKADGSADIWHFIEGLNWLNPTLAISIGNTTPKKSVSVPFTRIKNDNALLWIYENLSQLTLSVKLRWLISDFEHLSNCYEVTAFLRNEKYSQALILCLQAIEQNQPNLIAQIETNLYSYGTRDQMQHKRSSSHPNFSVFLPIAPNAVTQKPPTTPVRSKLQKSVSMIGQQKNKMNITVKKNLKLRPWSSLPNLISGSPKVRSRSQTISQPIGIPRSGPVRLTTEALKLLDSKIKRDDRDIKNPPSFSYRQFPSDSGGSSGGGGHVIDHLLKPITIVKCDDIKIHLDRKYMSPREGTSPLEEHVQQPSPAGGGPQMKHPQNLAPSSRPTTVKSKTSLFPSFFTDPDIEEGEASTSKSIFSKSAPSDFVSTFIPQVGVKLKSPQQLHPSFNNDGQFSLPQSTGTGYFPRPIQGQSLASFLQTAQFSRTNTELDRENAHFSVAEAMISAIEQLKWTKFEKYSLKNSWSESGEEKIVGATKGDNDGEGKTVRKRRRKRLKCWDQDTEGRSPATDSSDNDSSTFSNVSSANLSEDDDDDDKSQRDPGNLSYLKALSVSSHSINDHMAYAEWGENTREALSAEGVALSLISKFGDKQLPRASELMWLVSEQDAPQQLLPMPGSWSVNPDIKYNSFLRGTRDWAPPRAQIIFTRHPPPDRKKMMISQNYRCAGCGMRVAPNISHRFRYCEYLGKYHCTGCHRNQMSAIPARVLTNWDFGNCPVSVFSYRLLNQIWTFPLFCVCDLNPKLYTKIGALKLAYEKRVQLKFVKDFIMSCRFAVDSVQKLFNTISGHLTEDIENWSMNDFVAVKRGVFTKGLNELIVKCEEHIGGCELCMARGFLCERCPKKQVIFPWQRKVRRCGVCGACYHDTCWMGPVECTKCIRLRKRQKL